MNRFILGFGAAILASITAAAAQPIEMKDCIVQRARDFEPLMDNMADAALIVVDFCYFATTPEPEATDGLDSFVAAKRASFHAIANVAVVSARSRRIATTPGQ